MIIGISGRKQHGKDTVGKLINYISTGGPERYQSLSGFLTHYDDAIAYPYPWRKKMFAEKLKQIVCLLIGCTMRELENEEFKDTQLGEGWDCWAIDGYSPGQIILFPLDVDILWIAKGQFYWKRRLTPRTLLQLLGTDCGRKIIHPNIWVNATMSDYKIHVITHRDEAELTSGGYIIPTKPNIPVEYHGKPVKTKSIVWTTESEPNWVITDVRHENEVSACLKHGVVIRVIDPRKPISASEHESEFALDNYSFEYVIANDGTIEELANKVKTTLLQIENDKKWNLSEQALCS